MKKALFVSLISFSVSLFALSQETDNGFKKNAIKLDLGKLFFNEAGITYERWINNKVSISASFASFPTLQKQEGYARGTSNYFNGSQPVKDSSSTDNKYSYFYFSAKLKYFISKNAPKGLYFGGALFFVNNKVVTTDYDKKTDGVTGVLISETRTEHTQIDLNYHIGLSVGYNIILGKRINIDPSVEILTNPLSNDINTQQNSNIYANIAIGFMF